MTIYSRDAHGRLVPATPTPELDRIVAKAVPELAAAYAQPPAPEPVREGPPCILPVDAKARKDMPITTGVFDYFPLALAEVARVSKAGNDQHNPGQPLHWSKHKSTDHADCIGRHLIDRGTRDPLDNQRHSGKLAWRALALLETELEAEAMGVTVAEYIEILQKRASVQGNQAK
jgi:hypothetical protein